MKKSEFFASAKGVVGAFIGAVLGSQALFAAALELQSARAMPAAEREGLNVFTGTMPLEIGNYDVSFTFGDKEKPTRSTVKFEGRRVALARVETAPGEFKTLAFTARVKGPIAKDGVATAGESPFPHALNLTILTTQETPPAPVVTPSPDSRTIYLCGDSTVTDQQREPWGSWGQCLCAFFKEGVAVANFARSGLHTTSFRQQGRIDRILEHLKSGDVVVIQFGHNDQKQAWLKPFEGYKKELAGYIERFRAKGAEVVIVSPMERLRFDPKTHEQQPKTLADYAKAAEEIACECGVKFIDLNDASARIYGALGAKEARRLFCTASVSDQMRDYFGDGLPPGQKKLRDIADKTHHSIYGAYVLAHFLADELAAKVPSLAAYRRDGVERLDPAAPEKDPGIPPSGQVDNSRPEGDTGNKE